MEQFYFPILKVNNHETAYLPYNTVIYSVLGNIKQKETLDIYIVLLHDLSYRIKNNLVPENNELVVEIDSKKLNKFFTKTPTGQQKAMSEELKQYDISQIAFVLLTTNFRAYEIQNNEVIGIDLYSGITYKKEKRIIEIKYNADFIQLMKENLNSEVFDKLYVNVMLGISSLKAKQLYSLLCLSHRQLHQYGTTNQININGEYDNITPNFVVMSRNVIDFPRTIKAIRTNLEQINKAITRVNEKCGTTLPLYRIEFYGLSKSKNEYGEFEELREREGVIGKYTKYRIYIEAPKTMRDIINAYTENIELREALYSYLLMSNEAKLCISHNEFEQMLSELSMYSEAEQILMVNTSTSNEWRGFYVVGEKQVIKAKQTESEPTVKRIRRKLELNFSEAYKGNSKYRK